VTTFAGVLVVLLALTSSGTAAPPNDDCSTATTIAALPFSDVLDVTGVTSAITDPTFDCVGANNGSPSVWYSYTAPAPISLEIDTFGSDFDTSLLVWGGTCGAETGPLDCNSDDYDVFTFIEQSRVIVTLGGGDTALIEARKIDAPAVGTSLHLNVKESSVFRVSPFVEDGNQRPAIARREDEFLLAWSDFAFVDTIQARRYDLTGTALAPSFQVNTSPVSYSLPDVASTDDGFVLVWTTSTGVGGRLVDATGTPVGAEFSVIVSGHEYPTAVAVRPGGDFMVVWPDTHYPEGGIRARLFDSTGAPLGADFLVNSATGTYSVTPDVAADAAGNFIVVWATEPPAPSDSDGLGVVARRFGGDGTPLGPEFQVNAYTTGQQRYPAVAADGDGNFLVAWADGGDGDCFFCVDAQRYDAGGSPIGAVVRLGDEDTGTYGFSEGQPLGVAADGAGNFVVAWPGAELAVVARRLRSDGLPIGAAPFTISHLRDGYQYHSDVAAAPAGDFVVVWDWSPYGSKYDVMGRHVTPLESGVCTAAPRDALACRHVLVAGKSKLNLRDRAPDTSDSLTWKFVRGQAATPAALGDPLGSDTYALCLYDGNGFLMEQAVGPGGTCGTRPCWSSLGPDGFRYVDKQGVRGPVRKLVLKPGDDGESKVVAKMKGEALVMPALPISPPIRAQLQVTNGECWDVEYVGAGVLQNTATDVKAVGPNP